MSRKRVLCVALVALILGIASGAFGDRLYMQSNKGDANDVIPAKGKLLPQVRHQLYYNGLSGRITKFDVNPGEVVPEDRVLFHVQDIEQANKLADLESKWQNAIVKKELSRLQASQSTDPTGKEQGEAQREAANQELQEKFLKSQIDTIRDMMEVQAAGRDGNNFIFTVKAPKFTPDQAELLGDKPRKWMILNSTFKEDFTNRTVRPSDPILRLGAIDGPWELEIQIPGTHIGQVKLAFQRLQTDTLDVELTLKSEPTRKFQGKLPRNTIAGEAKPSQDESALEEVIAYVRIDGADIEPSKRVPPELRVTGTELDATIRGVPAK